MLTKAKSSLFLGLLEWQIMGRKEVVRPVMDVGDFLVQRTDNKDFAFRDPSPWPVGLLAGSVKEAKWPWEPWLQLCSSSSAFVILGISKSPPAR